jgi:hypothetical protein
MIAVAIIIAWCAASAAAETVIVIHGSSSRARSVERACPALDTLRAAREAEIAAREAVERAREAHSVAVTDVQEATYAAALHYYDHVMSKTPATGGLGSGWYNQVLERFATTRQTQTTRVARLIYGDFREYKRFWPMYEELNSGRAGFLEWAAIDGQ